MCAVFFLLLRYNEWLVAQTGTSQWAEKWFGGEGGTRLMLKFLSLLGFMMGMLVILNMHNSLIKWILGPLLRAPLT
jgi:hypothetical protein